MSDAERCTTAVAMKAAMPSSPGRPSVAMSEALLQEMAGFFESALEFDNIDDPISPKRRALRKTERLLKDLRQVDRLDNVDALSMRAAKHVDSSPQHVTVVGS